MAISNANASAFNVVKDTDWFSTSDSGDKTTYDADTFLPHVKVT